LILRMTIAVVVALSLAGFPRSGQAQTSQPAVQTGIRELQANDFAAAERTFSRLVQADPSAQNYGYLAMAEASSGKLQRAIADFQKSIQLGNNTPGAYYNLGLAYDQDHQPEPAIQEFRKAVGMDPSYLPARYALGIVLLNTGRTAEAMQVFAEARKQDPRDPRLWAGLANAEFESGHSSQAIQTAQNAVQAIPDNPRLAVTLATLCLHHHQIQAARDLLEDANELMPQNAEVRILLARASLAAGEPVEALAVLRGLTVAGEEAAEKLELSGEAQAMTGNLAAAEEDLASAVSDSPGNARYLITDAWIRQLRGQHNEAIKMLAQAQARDPEAPVIPYRMAASYYFLHQYGQAEQSCRQALRLNPRYGAAYLLLGIVEVKQKDFNGALTDIERAVSTDPGEAIFHRELGEAMFQAGKPAGAGKELDTALRLNPKDAEGYYWQAKLLASEGAKQRAIAELNTSIELKPGYTEAYQELAQLYKETGQPDQAAKALAAARRQTTAPASASGEGLLRSSPDAAP
jgi:tetratricopeptide (TPR) repeat protein